MVTIVVHFTFSCPKLFSVCCVNLSACPVGSHPKGGQLLGTEIFNTGRALHVETQTCLQRHEAKKS